MAIPDYQTCMLPVLKFHSDGQEHTFRETIEALAREFGLTDDECREMLPSGGQEIFDNRVGWARTYLKKAGLLEAPKRGLTRITERGLEVLGTNPQRVDAKYLSRFEEFQAFQARHRSKTGADAESRANGNDAEPETNDKTPEESLENAYQKLRSNLAADLLQNLKSCSPSFFERLVVDVIVKMGYGGTRKDAGQAIGRGGDGGIDGIVKEDKLGLDAIYIQAKRWENTVGRPEIQKFVGVLTGERARKGLFITTSDFSRDAREFVKHLETKVVLIDGETLADLMIDHNVGVSTVSSYEIKRVDSDYFTEE
ncbi:restriction endonuclease [Candidatus Sumerlaeota bacterium]|nr:restriction endonuclease [Candidatus Sumerlaeota bacterium]